MLFAGELFRVCVWELVLGCERGVLGDEAGVLFSFCLGRGHEFIWTGGFVSLEVLYGWCGWVGALGLDCSVVAVS